MDFHEEAVRSACRPDPDDGPAQGTASRKVCLDHDLIQEDFRGLMLPALTRMRRPRDLFERSSCPEGVV
jgi:hypothetical protein